MSKTLNKVVSEMEAREQLGILKYSTTVDRDDLSKLDWLQHLKEELMDAVLYVQRVIDHLE